MYIIASFAVQQGSPPPPPPPPDIASDEDEKDIISEMKVLQHVGAHPNVVSLLGASIHAGKMVSIEYIISSTHI